MSSVEQNGEDEAMIREVQKITPSGNSAQSSVDSESVRKIWDNVQKNRENKNPSPRSNPKESTRSTTKRPASSLTAAKIESTKVVTEHTKATMEDLFDTMKKTGFFTKDRLALLNPRDAQAIAELMAFKGKVTENKAQQPNNAEQTQSNNEQTEKIRESADEQSHEQSENGEKVQVSNEARQVGENFRDAMNESRKAADIIAKARFSEHIFVICTKAPLALLRAMKFSKTLFDKVIQISQCPMKNFTLRKILIRSLLRLKK